jgi:acyl-CoA thioesterase-1
VRKVHGPFQRPAGLYFLGRRRASRREAVDPGVASSAALGSTAGGSTEGGSSAVGVVAIDRRCRRRTRRARLLGSAIARSFVLAFVIAPVIALGITLGCGGADEPGSTGRGRASADQTPADVARSIGRDPHDDHPAPAEPVSRREDRRPAIVFLGTSLTAGYGLPEDEAFPARIQRRIEARGLDHRIVNAGVSGDTSAGGLRRLDWLLRLPIAVLVIELGANDMLRGQSIEALGENLDSILERTRAAHPEARFLIAGMRAAPNLGPRYAKAFDAVYPALAERWDAELVPFLLEDVAAVRRLNQADGIHPTAEGHALIADRIWKRLEPLLESP